MIKYSTKFLLVMVCTVLAIGAFAQPSDTSETPKDWFLLDPEADHVLGVSAEKAYQTLLKDKPSKTVLVAVIDSGIDINHEDLKDIIWTNPGEIPDNGIDDDKNGYIDDVHGWNFIGGKNGNVDHDNLELTREYKRLKAKYENVDEKSVGKKEKEEYAAWKSIKEDFEKSSTDAKQKYDYYQGIYENIVFGNDTLKQILNVKKLTLELVETIPSKDPKDPMITTKDKRILIAQGSVAIIFRNIGPDADVDAALVGLKGYVEHFENQVKFGFNPDFDGRSIVGDNYSNIDETNYGNNDVKGPEAEHGTHVAGIIGANRKNTIGIKGIADNVKIMSVRTVPDGDERDKDVANAIRYAVNNGAKIINMSFGKAYSPNKDAVDRAVKYAESKGVLLIHAAGNDGENNDTDKNFPNRYYLKKGKEAKNWIEIGASAWGANDEMVASFSNYGKKSVDMFAPGVEIYSTTPENTYKNESGTSMASPATAGVAALIMSYFPELTGLQVKEILRQSTRKFDNLKVNKPNDKDDEDGKQEQVNFSDLSSTGGLVNAYEAVKLAMTYKGGKIEK